MMKAGFVGFGEVNTPAEIIVRKCSAAEAALKAEGVSLVSVYPVTDDYEERDIQKALSVLKSEEFDFLVLCIAGWIPTHAVIKITEQFREKPMVLWGLCGWMEEGRLVTTADQAGTSALRKTMEDLGYTFRYVYDVIGRPTRSHRVAEFGLAAQAANLLRTARIGMAGYRDMNLYGTLCDGVSLKRVIGPEIETFELLEVKQRFDRVTQAEKDAVIENSILKWKFLKPAARESLELAAGYYLAVHSLVKERGYTAISLKDVDGMKKLLGFPPAPIFMLLANCDGLCTIPENDCLGNVTQLMVKALTAQCAPYLEFYEYFTDGVLAGVPDYIPAGATDGEITVMPAAFGELSEGILNVSRVKTGELTMCRLVAKDGRYVMHLCRGRGETPDKWEEAGWTQPAPQLPGLKIYIDDVERFAEHVACQHYIIAYGDIVDRMMQLCKILGIGVFLEGEVL